MRCHQLRALARTLNYLKRRNNSQYGGAAIEYLLVSAFGLLLSMSVVALVSRVVQDKLSAMGEEVGFADEDLDLNPFD